MRSKLQDIVVGSVSLGLLGLAPLASALEFQAGEVDIRVDTEISWGAQWSTQDADERYLYSGIPAGNSLGLPASAGNGGTNPSPNEDNGRLNFNTGLISNQLKGRSEIRTFWEGFGTKTDVLYFYDTFIKDHSRRRTQPSKASDREIAADIRTIENYAYWEGFVDDRPVTIRIGDQVINWGEANLIPGTNSFINPLDLNRILSPTFDSAETYRPIGAVFGSFSVLPNLVLEAYVQYDWEPTQLPPGGSFYANTDYVGEGVNHSGEGFICLDGGSAGDTNSATDVCINMNERESASQHGQHGIRANFFLEELNQTEMSLYYVKYHSRLPHVGSPAAGGIPNLFSPAAATVDENLTPILPPGALQTAQAAIGFHEDIEVWGASFNTNVLDGYALSGEATLRKDYPLQIHTTEMLCSAGYVFNAGAGVNVPLRLTPTCAGTHIPAAAPGQRSEGFDEQDVMQLQASIAKTFAHVLGGDQFLALLEIGYAKVLDMPGHDELLYETDDVGASGLAARADASGWGYRLVLGNEYTGLFEGLNIAVSPVIVFAHDVNGNMVKNLALFHEDKKQLVAGLTFDYQNQYAVNLKYNTYFGGKDRNMSADRDTISLSFTADF